MHPTPEIEILKQTYAALNRNDIPAVVAPFDPEIEWIEPPEYGKTCHGRAAVEAHLTMARGKWVEGACEPERFFSAGDRVVVFLSIHVRLKNEADFREGRHAAVFTFRSGKAIEMRIFDDCEQALTWAGVEATDPD